METLWIRWAFFLAAFEGIFCEEGAELLSSENVQLSASDERHLAAAVPQSHGPAMPGDDKYWTKLLGLGFSEGTLEKVNCDGKCHKKLSFDPDHMDYKLTIKSGKSKELLVTPMLNSQKYNLLFKPNLIWNGKNEKYSPIQNIEFAYSLDRSGPGQLDEKVTLVVQDPSGGGGGMFGGGAKSNTYTIEVIQAPDIEKIVTAKNIKVVGLTADGGKSSADGTFDRKSPHNEVRYIVGQEVDKVKLTVDCPAEATGLKYNGKKFSKGEEYTSGLFEGATKSILGQCLYEDPKYTHGEEMQRTYVITIARNASVGGSNVDLRMWPPNPHGKCTKLKDGTGWKCMKGGLSAQFVGSYDNPKAELVVINKKSKARYRLWNGIPTSIPVPEDKHADDLVLEAGAHRKQFNFSFGRPPQCSEFHWPQKYHFHPPPEYHLTGKQISEMEQGAREVHMHQGAYWFPPDAAWKHDQRDPKKSWKCPKKKINGTLVPQEVNTNATVPGDTASGKVYCVWEPCAAPEDIPDCCTPVRQPCSALPPEDQGTLCGPYGQFDPIGELRCQQWPCKKDGSERPFCCKIGKIKGKKLATCSSMAATCGKFIPGTVVGAIHMGLSCMGPVCVRQDADLCCQPRAICDTMVCPAGFSPKYNAALFLCAGTECKITDRDACCNAAAYCDSFSCPGPMKGRFQSPLGWTPKLHANTIPCGGEPCLEWDTGICCNKVGFCSTLQCPLGFYPIPDAASTPCLGGTPPAQLVHHVEQHRQSKVAASSSVGTKAEMTTQAKLWKSDHNQSRDLSDELRKCTLEEDQDRCCLPAAKCSSYVCPLGYDFKVGAAAITCPGAVCDVDRDRSRCCDMVNPFQAATNIGCTSQLLPKSGEGSCKMLDSPQNWQCDATRLKLRLTLKLHFDQPVSNKLWIQPAGEAHPIEILGRDASIPIHVIDSASLKSSILHIDVLAVVAGRGRVSHRITIATNFPGGQSSHKIKENALRLLQQRRLEETPQDVFI